MSRNAEIAELLEEFADRLEALDVEFKPRAYRRAAENILDYPVAIEEVAADGPDALDQIEGVGEAIAEKVIEYLEDGEIEELEELRAELPARMDELTAVEGVGPKTVGKLYEALGITSLDELEAAATAEEIRTVSGFGPKTEENILANIPFAREAQQRELLGHARPVADDVLAYLDELSPVERTSVAGSIRRWKPTIGDIDIVIASEDPRAVIDRFTEWDSIETIIEAGSKKASVRARAVQIDIRVVAPDQFGSALQYFTGSRDHNVRARNRAIERGLKMNEYGVFDISDLEDADADSDTQEGKRIAGESETSMYEAIDLPWIPPEMREDTGEIDAAAAGTLPTVVDHDDIRGDLHVHSNWSDGNDSIETMVESATEQGYSYLAICDHASGPGIVASMGLDEDRISEQITVIEEVNEIAEMQVFSGVEANIDADGEIDISADLLSSLDVVVASPHSALDQDTDEATARLVAAVSHPDVSILGHPTGRMLHSRTGLELRIDDVAAAAAAHDTALEVNANPRRLDLDGMLVRAALEHDVPIAINTDAHSPVEYAHMRYGVHTARRGWATAADVINTWSVEELSSFLNG